MLLTSFPFNALPRELRDRVWTFALPKPRLVYVERHLDEESDDPKTHDRNESRMSYTTYFTSQCSQSSIPSLLYVCKESRAIVHKSYSQIFPGTWFCFAKDYLFLDWGDIYRGTEYYPEDFLLNDLSFERKHEACANPRILYLELAKNVQNLVLRGRYDAYDRWRNGRVLVNDVLPGFPGVKRLVLADQLHHECESAQELTWIVGEIGDEDNQHTLSDGDPDKFMTKEFVNLILWAQYRKCDPVDQQFFVAEWKKVHPDLESPQLIRRSIVTTALKQQLQNICAGPQKSMRQLASMDWGFVLGRHPYHGNLNLDQQIAYLTLVVSRIPIDFDYDEYVHERYTLIDMILPLLLRKEALEVDRGFKDLIASEAEEEEMS